MKKHFDIFKNETEIDKSEDKLDRVDYLENLANYIDRLEDSYVISLHSDYGTGKTFFLKMLKKELKEKSNKVIYFNAWKNDDVEPLTAFIGEMYKEFSKENNTEILDKAVDTMAKFIKYGAPVALNIGMHALFNKLGIDKESIQYITKGNDEIFKEEVKNYESRANQKKEFINCMENFRKDLVKKNPNKKIVIIIDELDRCRPDYAVNLLETIKHFFDIKGYTFVLSADRKHLTNTVKKMFGDIDTVAYLRKFIDYEVNLPNIKIDHYLDLLFNLYKIDSNYIDFLKAFFSKTDTIFTLRDLEKYLLIFVNIIKYYKNNNQTRFHSIDYIYSSMIFLIYKIKFPKIYEELRLNLNFEIINFYNDTLDEIEYKFVGIKLKNHFDNFIFEHFQEDFNQFIIYCKSDSQKNKFLSVLELFSN